MSPRSRCALAWLGALAAALALHLAVFVALQWRARQTVVAPARQALQATVRVLSAPPAPTAAPALVQPVPAAPTAARPMSPPTSPRALPASAPPAAAPPAAPIRDAEPGPDAPQWLDANQADSAPVPLDNRWLLAAQPWPAAFPRVRVRMWISAAGRIERVEIEGEAADDPAVRALFAPIADTSMRPAMVGAVPVPSVMRVELWPGDEDRMAPDFVLPLPP